MAEDTQDGNAEKHMHRWGETHTHTHLLQHEKGANTEIQIF